MLKKYPDSYKPFGVVLSSMIRVQCNYFSHECSVLLLFLKADKIENGKKCTQNTHVLLSLTKPWTADQQLFPFLLKYTSEAWFDSTV